jgi:hypothetical protein
LWNGSARCEAAGQSTAGADTGVTQSGQAGSRRRASVRALRTLLSRGPS